MAKTDHANVRLPPPLIVLGLLAAGLALDGRLFDPRWNAQWAAISGALFVAAGLTIGLSSVARFRRAGTNPEPWKPSAVLVLNGAYRFTRNPMYLGMLLIATGLALAAGGPWTMLTVPLIWAVLNFHVVAREEAYLRRRFGKPYEEYQRKIRRWL